MTRRVLLSVGLVGSLVAGGWGISSLIEPTDAERMPEVSPDDFKGIDAAIDGLYQSISGPAGQDRDVQGFRGVLAEGAVLVSMRPSATVEGKFEPLRMTPDVYIERAMPMLVRAGFTEKEIGRRLEVYGTIAHAMSAYQGDYKNAAGEALMVRGVNSIQLVNENGQWKVLSILWDTEWPDESNPLPERYIQAQQSE